VGAGRFRIASIALVSAICAAAVTLHPTGSAATAPISSGCPRPGAHVGVVVATIDQVIAVARSRVLGSPTHYQGRTERRTRQNTPVEAVIVDFGLSTVPGARRFLVRATRRCGLSVARNSSVVVFHDGLSVIADAAITEFVVRTDRGWSVYRA
jgi:hypothetical protein